MAHTPLPLDLYIPHMCSAAVAIPRHGSHTEQAVVLRNIPGSAGVYRLAADCCYCCSRAVRFDSRAAGDCIERVHALEVCVLEPSPCLCKAGIPSFSGGAQ